MPYPPLSSSSHQSPGGPSGLQPWHFSRFRGPQQARTLTSSSHAPTPHASTRELGALAAPRPPVPLAFPARCAPWPLCLRPQIALASGSPPRSWPWQIYDDPVILQSRLLLYIHIYRQGITYPCSPRAASWQGRALSWTPRVPASVWRPPQSVRLRPAVKPAYAYRHTYVRLLRYYLILYSAFLFEHQTEHQGLLSMR